MIGMSEEKMQKHWALPVFETGTSPIKTDFGSQV